MSNMADAVIAEHGLEELQRLGRQELRQFLRDCFKEADWVINERRIIDVVAEIESRRQ